MQAWKAAKQSGQGDLGKRSATAPSVPIPPGHGRAPEVATASGVRNHEITQTTSAIAARTTISTFFIVQAD